MRRLRQCVCLVLATFGLALMALAASKAPVVVFGKWMAVDWFVGSSDDKPVAMRVRALFVNGRMREYTTGEPHVITDSSFAVQRAYRLNDLLPGEKDAPPRWRWQRGGWLLVNRTSGRVSQISLPHFDPQHSEAVWYRDYAAYCGLSDDGQKLFAVVIQLGRRKPLVQQALGPAELGPGTCSAPHWQRQPARVTFEPAGTSPLTFEIRGHAAEPAPAEPEESAE
jgi:hypothetical protein